MPGGNPGDPGGPGAVSGGDPGDGTLGGPLGGAFGSIAAALTTLGMGRPEIPLSLILTMTTTTGVVGAALAFSVFGKRRRDGEPPAPDEILAEAAALGVGVAAAALAPVALPVAAPDLEAAMPRWRRPSLLEARKADPVRDPIVTSRLTFDHGLVGALDGRERRFIRYTVVRLLDQPDELRGAEIGFVDSGDEVQLLEKHGVYWLVLCPDGRQGWIHKMTLGDVVGAPEPSRPTATMPLDADTWTMGDDVDGDVLAAYLESRRRG
ncbi:MAG: SH3 domain-containing protein [Chloroflexota bacterium]